jgi:CRISPR-associated protein Cas5t
MKFIRIKASGCLNSFRQPDFHTYHKTLPLPPKTTVAGMIGGALGISPKEVNDEWLKPNRFQIGIVGKANGKANDLWQIRKYETKQIAAYNKGTESTPYKTAVIVRELLYASKFLLYLTFQEEKDFELVFEKLHNPSWALSLGREDELIKIDEIKQIDLSEQEDIFFQDTVLPFDVNIDKYEINLQSSMSKNIKNILSEAPKTIKLPMTFSHKKDSEAREADYFQVFTFISNLPIRPKTSKGYLDIQESCAFQIF